MYNTAKTNFLNETQTGIRVEVMKFSIETTENLHRNQADLYKNV
jgi:hypothetical protein